MMEKKIAIAAAMALALPAAAQAQSLQPGGFYIGAEGGINWMLNTNSKHPHRLRARCPGHC